MVTRINGFSGMDVDSLVKSMMAAKRVPLDKLNQEKQLLEWKRDSYRQINSKLYEFKSSKLTDKYGRSDALNAYKALTTGNTDALKAEATAEANGIDMEITVKKLASYATVETTGVGSGKSSSQSLLLMDAERVASNDGKVFSEMSVAEQEAIVKSLENKKYDIKVNGVTFSFTGQTSISAMVSTISSHPDAKAMANFDEVTGQLLIRSKTSGAAGKVEVNTTTDNESIISLFKGIKRDLPGEDAEITINGNEVKKNSNNFVINGINLTLVGTTPSDKPVTVTTQRESTKVLDTIKGFVEDYNSLLSLLNTKTNENKYRTFSPLTDEQKKEMKEADIATWTEKAQSGLLKNDDILRSVVSSMRSIITEKLGTLDDIGITTGKYYENGKLILNESKLKEAIADNPQKIIDLLHGPTSAPLSGMFDIMSDKIGTALEQLSERAGTNRFSSDLSGTYKEESVMGRSLKNYNNRIDVMQKNLTTAENRYYKQFEAMEKAMVKLQSQSSNLLSSLGLG